MVLVQEHGVEGFLHGLAPRLLRRAFMAAISWTVYEQVSAGSRPVVGTADQKVNAKPRELLMEVNDNR